MADSGASSRVSASARGNQLGSMTLGAVASYENQAAFRTDNVAVARTSADAVVIAGAHFLVIEIAPAGQNDRFFITGLDMRGDAPARAEAREP